MNPARAPLFILIKHVLQNGLVSWVSVLVPRPVQACAGMPVPPGPAACLRLPPVSPSDSSRLSFWPGRALWRPPVLSSGWKISVLGAGCPLLVKPLVAGKDHTAPSRAARQPLLGAKGGVWGEEYRGQIRNVWWQMMK